MSRLGGAIVLSRLYGNQSQQVSSIMYTELNYNFQDSYVNSLHQEDTLALLSGDEAVAIAAFEAGVTIGTGYPGTPSTEKAGRESSVGTQ